MKMRAALATMRLRAGKVEELFGLFDALGMLQQLGAIPSPSRGRD
jgi:hypothetical protein